MKKVLLLTCSIVVVVFSQAQVVKKGDKLFGGSFSFSVFNVNQQTPGYYNSGNAGIYPSIAVAIKDNLTLGIRLDFNYSKAISEGTQRNEQRSIGLGSGIFLKKYKLLQDRFGVYFDNSLNGSIYSSRTKAKDNTVDITTKTKAWSTKYSFTPGVFYKFSERFLGEANIGGGWVSYSKGNNSDNSTFGVGASFLQYFNLGINYLISKRSKS